MIFSILACLILYFFVGVLHFYVIIPAFYKYDIKNELFFLKEDFNFNDALKYSILWVIISPYFILKFINYYYIYLQVYYFAPYKYKKIKKLKNSYEKRLKFQK